MNIKERKKVIYYLAYLTVRPITFYLLWMYFSPLFNLPSLSFLECYGLLILIASFKPLSASYKDAYFLEDKD